MMKIIFITTLFCSLLHSGERNVLVEMFTNSHCTVCPGAHAAIDAFGAASAQASRVKYIFYHTTFPYSDDPLSLANSSEPNERNTYYHGPLSTPNTYFDGVNQGRMYSSFASSLEARLSIDSPFKIVLTGSKNGSTVNVAARIVQTGTVAQNDLVVHLIAVENVSYVGRNGVSPQNFVMRKMITPSSGVPIISELNAVTIIEKSAPVNNATVINNTGVVAFLQSVSTKEVFQSEFISYSALTGIAKEGISAPDRIVLDQNYPNPFNPSTTITFFLPRTSVVTLDIFTVAGERIATLFRGTSGAGTHAVNVSASDLGLSSGVYLYRLEAEGRTLVRRMVFTK